MLVESTNNDRVHLNKETLSDGSEVFDIVIDCVQTKQSVTIACSDENTAHKLFVVLSDADDYLLS